MSTANVVLVWSEKAEDEPWLRRVRQHLESLGLDGTLRVLDAHEVAPGAVTAAVQRATLDEATVAVVLVSAALLARPDLVRDMLDPLVDRATDGLVLIPVHIHPTVAEQKPLGRRGVPLTGYEGIGAVDAALDGLSWGDAERKVTELARRVRACVVGAPAVAMPSSSATVTTVASGPQVAPSAARLVVEFERRDTRLITRYSRPGESALEHSERA
jgi:hypothetical protein